MTFKQVLFILFGLGLYHGINPAMGWLLAASQGLQKKSFGTLLKALGALTLGHIAAIALAVFGYVQVRHIIPQSTLEWIIISLLIGLGVYHLIKRGHKAWLGTSSSLAAVALWSFLIATAHGAGVMILPFLKEAKDSWFSSFLLILSHTLGFMIAASFAAIFLYYTLNLQLLKKFWVNFDLFWAYSLILTGIFYIFFFLL